MNKAQTSITSKSNAIGTAYRILGSPTLMDRDGEGDANARLIAAAPDLYAALQRLADRVEQIQLPDGSTPDTMEARAILYAIGGEAL